MIQDRLTSEHRSRRRSKTLKMFAKLLLTFLVTSAFQKFREKAPSSSRGRVTIRVCVCAHICTHEKEEEGRELGISQPRMQTSRKLHPPTLHSFIRQEVVSVLLVSISVLHRKIQPL